MIHFGKQPPQYKFILNPYVDARFTSCPKCNRKMGQRKLPLVIHVRPDHVIALNKTCRYCSHCDLLIAHQDELAAMLAAMFPRPGMALLPEEDYLVLGTLDRKQWKQGQEKPPPLADLQEYLHDFKKVMTVTVTGGWVMAPERRKRR
jgi:hypothetical protein